MLAARASSSDSSKSFPSMRLLPLCRSFRAPRLCFQQLTASFCKTPGIGVYPRNASCRINNFQTLSLRPVCNPVTPGGHHVDFVVLCFHKDTNRSFRKSFIFTSMQIPRGVGGLRMWKLSECVRPNDLASGGRRRRRRVRGRCCRRNFWRRRRALTSDRGSTAGCRCRRSLRPCCA